jgi:chromosome segregation ATPase
LISFSFLFCQQKSEFEAATKQQIEREKEFIAATYKEEVDDLQKKLEMERIEVAKKTELVGEHWITILKLRSIGKMFKNKSESLEKAMEEKSRMITNLEVDVWTIRNEIGTFQSSLQQLKDSKTKSREEIENLTKNIAMKAAENYKTDVLVKNLKTYIIELVERGRNYQIVAEKSQTEVAKLSKELVELKKANTTLETSMEKNKRKKISNSEKSFETKSGEEMPEMWRRQIDDLRKWKNIFKEKSESLKREIEEKKEKFRILKDSKIADDLYQEKKLFGLQRAISRKVTENFQLKNQLEKSNKTADSLKGRFERAQSANVHLNKTLEESRKEIDTLKNKPKADQLGKGSILFTLIFVFLTF